MNATIKIKEWLGNFFGTKPNDVVAIWGGENRCMIEIKGLGAFEITATEISHGLPPDVKAERLFTKP